MNFSFLNLLPVEQKNAVRRDEVRRTVLFLAALTVCIFLIGAVLLLPSYLPLVFQQNELRRTLDIEKQAVGTLGLEETIKDMRIFSARAKAMQRALMNHPVASRLIEEMLNHGKDGVVFYGMTVGKDGAVAITGFARERADLLHLEERMKNSKKFSEITLRLVDIVRQADTEFSMSGTLAPEFRLSSARQ